MWLSAYISFCCPGVVSSEMLDNLQNAEIISILTKEFSEVRKEEKNTQDMFYINKWEKKDI